MNLEIPNRSKAKARRRQTRKSSVKNCSRLRDGPLIRSQSNGNADLKAILCKEPLAVNHPFEGNRLSQLTAPKRDTIRDSYNITMKALNAHLSQSPWFKIEEPFERFEDEPPRLFYPKLSREAHQNKCKDCLKSKEFFSSFRYNCKHFMRDVKAGKCNRNGILNFLTSMFKHANTHKLHELQELIDYVSDHSGQYAEDHPFKVEFTHLQSLQQYVSLSIERQRKLETKYVQKLGTIHTAFKTTGWKALNRSIREGRNLVNHAMKNIEEEVINRHRKMIISDPNLPTDRVLSPEDVLLTRLSNAIVITSWIKYHLKEYAEARDSDSCVSLDSEDSCNDLETLNGDHKQSISPFTLCNVRRRYTNAVNPKLPLALSHSFMMASGPEMELVHPTWFRILMHPMRVAEEHDQVRESNLELERDIEYLEKEIQFIEDDKRLYNHMKGALSKITH